MTQTAFLSKLLIENDGDDFVRFSFPNETRQIKCSISLLSEVSPVFKTMFSEKWCSQKIIKMDDHVQFDQFLTFKLFIDIIYGLTKEDALSVGQAVNVFFYSDKYQVDAMKDRIHCFIADKIEIGWISTTELEEVYNFIKLFQFDDLIKSLDNMELDLDAENSYEFYKLADKMQLPQMKEQVIVYCETLQPDPKWGCDFLCLVVNNLQRKIQTLTAVESKKNEKSGKNRPQKPIRDSSW